MATGRNITITLKEEPLSRSKAIETAQNLAKHLREDLEIESLSIHIENRKGDGSLKTDFYKMKLID